MVVKAPPKKATIEIVSYNNKDVIYTGLAQLRRSRVIKQDSIAAQINIDNKKHKLILHIQPFDDKGNRYVIRPELTKRGLFNLALSIQRHKEALLQKLLEDSYGIGYSGSDTEWFPLTLVRANRLYVRFGNVSIRASELLEHLIRYWRKYPEYLLYPGTALMYVLIKEH